MEFYTWMLVQALYRERAYSGSKNMDDFPTHVVGDGNFFKVFVFTELTFLVTGYKR